MIMKRINPPSLKGLEEPEQLTLSLIRNAPLPRTPPPPIGEAPFTEASHGIHLSSFCFNGTNSLLN